MVTKAELAILVTAQNQSGGALRAAEGDVATFSDKLNKASIVATAGWAAVGGAALKMATDFEHGLDQVGAVAGATEAEMESLRAKALEIGKDTAFSASQATQAMEELAAGGISVTDIIGGAADATVALAAAGGTDLALAAQAAATAMDVWGISADGLTGVVNNLAGAANVSKFGVEDMAGAMAQGGGVAAAAGVSFDDFAASIAATSSSFSSGSDAGTSFKTFLTSLANPADKAKEAMEAIGFSAYDAEGNLRSMGDIVQSLHDALGPLSEQQRAQAAATIFGTDAMRTALGLSQLTRDEFVALSDTMKNTDAAEVAAQRMGNLSGSFEAFKGSLETAGISLGTNFLPVATELVEKATGAVNAFGELDSSTQGWVFATAGVIAVAPKAISMVEGFAKSLKIMGEDSEISRVKVLGVAAGIGAAGIAADIILQKTTGHGLIEWVFGDPKKADELADSTARLSAAFAAAAEGGVQDIARAELTDILEDQAAAVEKLGGNYYFYAGAVEAGEFSTSSLEGRIEALGSTMVANKATTTELKEIYDQLPPVLQQVFDDTTDLTLKLEGEALALEVLNPALIEQGDAANFAGSNIREVFTPAVEESKHPIDAYKESLLNAEGGAISLDDALQGLIARFAAANPEVLTLQASNAILREEIDDLTASNETYSEKLGMTIEEMEGTIEKNDELIGGYQSNQEAIEGMQGQLEHYMGADGLGALMTEMENADRSFEDQIDIMGDASGAYAALADNDIPAAISAIGDLKTTLSPSEWDVLARSLGPVIVTAINEGVTDPTQKQLLIGAMQTLGVNAMAGFMAGIQASKIPLQTVVITMMDDTVNWAAGALDSKSPSRRFMALGEGAIEGFIIGMENLEGDALKQAEAVAARATAEAEARLADFAGKMHDMAGAGVNGGVPSGYGDDDQGVPAGPLNPYDRPYSAIEPHLTNDGRTLNRRALENRGWTEIGGEWYEPGKAPGQTAGAESHPGSRVTVNIGTVNANTPEEAARTGRDLAYSVSVAMGARGMA